MLVEKIYTPNATSTGLYNTKGTNWVVPHDAYGSMHLKCGTGGAFIDATSFNVRDVNGVVRMTVDPSSNLNVIGTIYSSGGHVVSSPNGNIDSLVDTTGYLQLSTPRGAYGINWWESDITLKENIKENQQDSLSKIMQINT